MTGFALLENFINNPKSLLRKRRSSAASSYATPPTNELVTPASSATLIMARSLCDYSVPTIANVPVGPAINTGKGNFELKTSLIMMVQQ
jgi:hypothetical protein